MTDTTQQGVDDLLAGNITPAEYIDIVRKDNKDTATREAQAVKKIASKRRKNMSEKNYDLPEGYSYELRVSMGEGVVLLYDGLMDVDSAGGVRTEQDLEDALARLSGKAAERENRLQRTRTMKKDLSASMGKLLDNVAHYRVP